MQIIPLNYSTICRIHAFLFDSFVTSSLSTIAPTININKRLLDNDRKRQLESHTLLEKLKKSALCFHAMYYYINGTVPLRNPTVFQKKKMLIVSQRMLKHALLCWSSNFKAEYA